MAWQGVIDSGNVLVQGAVPEMFAPQIKRDEGCSEADWLRLSLELWDLTRQPKYMRQAQITLFNEMAMNQFHTGDFGPPHALRLRADRPVCARLVVLHFPRIARAGRRLPVGFSQRFRRIVL